MMLDWLGQKHASPGLVSAASLLSTAVEQAYSTGELLPYELGGSDGTAAISKKVSSILGEL